VTKELNFESNSATVSSNEKDWFETGHKYIASLQQRSKYSKTLCGYNLIVFKGPPKN
jgi:hypothetical protein